MSKVEEKALEAYPSTSHYWNAEPDRNADAREFYKQGYQQAEKDLELTWKDMEKIVDLYDDVYCDFYIDGKGGKTNTEEHYQEVLKRFQERKES